MCDQLGDTVSSPWISLHHGQRQQHSGRAGKGRAVPRHAALRRNPEMPEGGADLTWPGGLTLAVALTRVLVSVLTGASASCMLVPLLPVCLCFLYAYASASVSVSCMPMPLLPVCLCLCFLYAYASASCMLVPLIPVCLCFLYALWTVSATSVILHYLNIFPFCILCTSSACLHCQCLLGLPIAFEQSG